MGRDSFVRRDTEDAPKATFVSTHLFHRATPWYVAHVKHEPLVEMWHMTVTCGDTRTSLDTWHVTRSCVCLSRRTEGSEIAHKTQTTHSFDSSLMYICIYVYVYMCIYVYMYICIYVYVYTTHTDSSIETQKTQRRHTRHTEDTQDALIRVSCHERRTWGCGLASRTSCAARTAMLLMRHNTICRACSSPCIHVRAVNAFFSVP